MCRRSSLRPQVLVLTDVRAEALSGLARSCGSHHDGMDWGFKSPATLSDTHRRPDWLWPGALLEAAEATAAVPELWLAEGAIFGIWS